MTAGQFFGRYSRMVNQIWTYQVIGAGNAACGTELRPDSCAIAARTSQLPEMFYI